VLLLGEMQRAFQDYMNDAKKRFEHDQQFPDEPKQVRDNEQIQIKTARLRSAASSPSWTSTSVFCACSWTKIPTSLSRSRNRTAQRHLRRRSADWPDYGTARAGPKQLYAERAAESRELLAQCGRSTPRLHPMTRMERTPLKSYSKLATGQANLFAERGSPRLAEQTYRIALGIVPSNVDAVTGLAGLLERTGRAPGRTQPGGPVRPRLPKQANDVKRFRRSGAFIYSQ